jgi:hypothetical protein
MAKQNPATDPVSAAMSAIESALNLTDDDGAVSVESASPPGSQAKPASRRGFDPASPRALVCGERPRERSEIGDSHHRAGKR